MDMLGFQSRIQFSKDDLERIIKGIKKERFKPNDEKYNKELAKNLKIRLDFFVMHTQTKEYPATRAMYALYDVMRKARPNEKAKDYFMSVACVNGFVTDYVKRLYGTKDRFLNGVVPEATLPFDCAIFYNFVKNLETNGNIPARKYQEMFTKLEHSHLLRYRQLEFANRIKWDN